MYNATYVLATYENSLIDKLAVIANNVSNVATPSFKADLAIFTSKKIDDVSGKVDFAHAAGTIIEDKQGSVKPTGSKLDVAIIGSGFFMVATPQGLRYTRNGSFSIDKDGRLVTQQGYAVLSSDGQEIVFDANDTDVMITSEGYVYSGPFQRGSIGVLEFENPRTLRKLGNSLYTSDVAPNASVSSTLKQGSIEESNVDSMGSMIELTAVKRDIDLSAELINSNFAIQRKAMGIYSRVGGN